MNSRILVRIIGFVILIFAVLMIFDFHDTLTIGYLSKLSKTQSFILKSLLELISAIFLLISGTEILKENVRGQKFLIIGTLVIFIKSLLYFEIRNYMLLILVIFICVFRFLLKLKK